MATTKNSSDGILSTLIQDVRYGLRLLWKSKAFTLAAIISLALGIGANTAIFSIVNSVFLTPLSFHDPQALVHIWATAPERGIRLTGNSLPKFRVYQQQTQVLEGVGATVGTTQTLTGHGDPVVLQGARVNEQFFRTLGIRPLVGRDFLPEEDRTGGPAVVMISNGFWQRRFGGDRSVVGKTIELNNVGHTVVGVLPPNLGFPYDENEIWLPRIMEGGDLTPEDMERGSGFLEIIARLKPGVSIEQGQASLSTAAEGYKQTYPGNVDANFGVVVKSFTENWVGGERSTFYSLFGAVGFVLLIACANVATLMIARFTRRSNEIAIRTALGASRGKIIRQFLTESILLSLLGGIVGAIIGVFSVRWLLAAGEEFIPRASEVRLDYRVFLFTFGVSLVVGVLIGLVPAIHTSRVNLAMILKEASRSSIGSAQRMLLRKVFVVVQIAMSVILLIGASLLITSFIRLQQVELGIDSKNLMAFDLSLPSNKYDTPAKQSEFYHQLLERMKTTPGIKSAAATDGLPVAGTLRTVYAVVGQQIPEVNRRPIANVATVTPTYFETMGIPLIGGRTFNDHDQLESAKVVMISKGMAQKLFPDQNAVGQHLIVGARSPQERQIVGVVGDVRPSLEEEPRDHVYLPSRQRPLAAMTVMARSMADGQDVMPSVREALKSLDSTLPILATMSMDNLIDRSLNGRRLVMVLMSLFAGLAMFMAAIGLSSTISYTVAERTNEIGIRMAMGAQRFDILKLIMRQGLFLIVIGIVIGLFGAYALTKLLASMLFGVSATEPSAFIAIAVALGFIALLACYLPARRATKIEPVEALRYE
ncbi:MAG TPA: ABC transporter permease [Pyrinomonadaceae bacterium]|nr:ABC transporter permease [Pyrinomonadaceae bacterium]